MPYIALNPAVAQAAAPMTLADPLTDVGETLESLRGELVMMLGGRVDITPERLNLWINFAYVDLCSSLVLDELQGSYSFNTVADQPLYRLPAGVGSTRGAAVVDTVTYGDLGGRSLDKSDVKAYRTKRLERDEPREYFRYNNMLVVYPHPSAAREIAVDFWIRPEKLIDDTDSPILPYEWHEPILMSARQKAYSALQEFDKAAAAQNDYINLIRRKEDRSAQEDTDKVVLSSVPRSSRDMRRSRRIIEDRY